MRSLGHILLGGVQFGEDEEHAQFQFRFLFVIVLSGIFTSGSFILGHLAEANPMGPVHATVMGLHIAACAFGRGEGTCPLAAVVRTHAHARAEAGEILLALAPPDGAGGRACALGRNPAA